MSNHHRKYEDTYESRHRIEQKDETPELYSIFCGEVASIQTYGAFVKIPGYRKNGLVHKTQISAARVEDVSEVLAVGDHVFCKVISLGEDDDVKISLSMKVVDQGKGKDLDANLVQTKKYEDTYESRHRIEQKDETPELYSIFCGEVASIQTYGAFVKIPGYRKNGLVHKTQISAARVEDVSEVLAVGDHVFCKVISLGEDDDVKISLSMKVVDQGKGKDLDANLVQTKQEEQRRNKGQTFVQPKIELGAVFNTVCRKCGTKGHLAKDCFQMPGSKNYDLLPDEDVPQLDPNEIRTSSTHRKKKKQEKKKKKTKKRRRRSESSDSSDAESDSSIEKRSHKHGHKHRNTSRESKETSKKHRRHRSPSPDSSDSGSSHNKHPHKHHHTSKERKEKSNKHQHHRSRSPDALDSSSHDTHPHRRPHKHSDTSGTRGEKPRKIESMSGQMRKHHRKHSSENSSSSDEYPHKHGHRHPHEGNGHSHVQGKSKPRHR